MTSIEWTEETWNPIRGCSRISEGCRNCYAEKIAARFSRPGQAYHGLANPLTGKWTGEVALVHSALDQPLRWKKPRRIFVNSMSDLFHEKVENGWMDKIYSVMREAHWHTFQVLTKRPERMLLRLGNGWYGGPLPNVWWGVSVEDQKTADERIPLLLQTPAAVRWVSYEPALGPVDFGGWVRPRFIPTGEKAPWGQAMEETRRLDWIVVGGESGPGARPFDLAWARKTIAQGRAAGVPVFVKQLGSRPHTWDHDRDIAEGVRMSNDGALGRLKVYRPRDRKGGDSAEWPADLRVREYPKK